MITHKFTQVVFTVSITRDSPQNHYSCSLNFIPKSVYKKWLSRLEELECYGIASGNFPDRDYVKIHFWASDCVIAHLQNTFPSQSSSFQQLSLW